jgi:hypothetical protein
MSAPPAVTGVTRPPADTVAMPMLDELHCAHFATVLRARAHQQKSDGERTGRGGYLSAAIQCHRRRRPVAPLLPKHS